MKLIKMTDYVLEQNKQLKSAPDAYDQYCKIVNYAQFLKEPVKLDMFIPCDSNIKPIKKPTAQQIKDVVFKGKFVIKTDRTDGLDHEIFLVRKIKMNTGKEEYDSIGWFNNGFLQNIDENILIEQLVKYDFELNKNVNVKNGFSNII